MTTETATAVETKNAIEEMLSLPVAREPLVVRIDVNSEKFKKSLQSLNDYLATPKGWQEFKEARNKAWAIAPRWQWSRCSITCMPSTTT